MGEVLVLPATERTRKKGSGDGCHWASDQGEVTQHVAHHMFPWPTCCQSPMSALRECGECKPVEVLVLLEVWMGSYWVQESTHHATEQRPETPQHWERRGSNGGPEKQWRERWKRESGARGARRVWGSNQRPGTLQGRTRSMQCISHVVAGTAERHAGASTACIQLPPAHHPAPLLSPPPSPSSSSMTSFPAAMTYFIVSLCSAPVLLLSHNSMPPFHPTAYRQADHHVLPPPHLFGSISPQDIGDRRDVASTLCMCHLSVMCMRSNTSCLSLCTDAKPHCEFYRLLSCSSSLGVVGRATGRVYAVVAMRTVWLEHVVSHCVMSLQRLRLFPP